MLFVTSRAGARSARQGHGPERAGGASVVSEPEGQDEEDPAEEQTGRQEREQQQREQRGQERNGTRDQHHVERMFGRSVCVIIICWDT